MERARRFFARHGLACFGLGVFAVCALAVFWPALPPYAALLSPDSGPFFQYAHRTDTLTRYAAGAAFTPHALYWLLFPPLVAHELTYIVDSLVLALAGVYYLRARRVHPAAAWFGGLALGLCGYTFTLFAAGHRGYFHMFSSAAWAFGLLARGFETRRLVYFAALGLVFAWGATCQPDVLVLVGGVAACYALWLTARGAGGEGGGLRAAARRAAAVWPRFAVSAAFLLVAGYGSLRSALTTTMASRDAQIAGIASSGQPAQAAPTPEKQAEERRQRWLFATGWSLPPEDALEFVAPGVFGDESMQGPYPYWGRLGRPADEVFQKGRMMPNYRGHTVYLGAVCVLFALFGVAARFSGGSGGRARSPSKAPPDAGSDVPFWCAVWVVCLFLALGRFTPFYRLFYALPYMDYIRAPVKFHHLVELATAALAGFGMDAFLRGPPALRRRLAWLAGGAAVALALGAGAMLASRGALAAHIASLGLGPASDALGGYAARNLARSAGLAAAVAAFAWWSARHAGERALTRLACAALAVLAAEQAAVARRYVRVINVAAFYRENAVTAAVRRAAGDRFVNVVNYVSPNARAEDGFSSSLELNGLRNLAPGAGDRETPYGRLFAALQADPVKLWRLCGVEYVVIPRKGSEPFLRAGVLEPVLDFELGPAGLRQAAAGEKTCLLAHVRGGAPGPRFVTSWRGGVPPEQQPEAAAREGADATDAPPPAQVAAGTGQASVERLASRGRPGVFATRVRVSCKEPGLLIFDERAADGLEARVDGAPQPVYRADGAWPAVLVGAGEHTVVLRVAPRPFWPVCGASAALAVLAWGLAVRARATADTAGRNA